MQTDIDAEGPERDFLRDQWLGIIKEHSRPGALPGVDFKTQTMGEAWKAFVAANAEEAGRAKAEMTECMKKDSLPAQLWEFALASAKGEFYQIFYEGVIEIHKTPAVRTCEEEVKKIEAELDKANPAWQSSPAEGKALADQIVQ